MAPRWMPWVFDPAHRFQCRRWVYTWLAVFFFRLAIWYHLEDRRCRRSLLDIAEAHARRWMAENAGVRSHA